MEKPTLKSVRSFFSLCLRFICQLDSGDSLSIRVFYFTTLFDINIVTVGNMVAQKGYVASRQLPGPGNMGSIHVSVQLLAEMPHLLHVYDLIVFIKQIREQKTEENHTLPS